MSRVCQFIAIFFVLSSSCFVTSRVAKAQYQAVDLNDLKCFLLKDVEVCDELGMTSKQKTIVEKEITQSNLLLARGFSEATAEVRFEQEILELDPHGENDRVRERVAEVTRNNRLELIGRINEVLNGRQVARLTELAWWYYANSEIGFVNTIFHDIFEDSFQIENHIKDHIVKRGNELQQEFDDELWKLKQSYRLRLLELLTEQQQRDFESMLGEESKYKSKRLRF